jgi:UDP-N-acetyl-D-mannosaminuronic acid dehydrogenase
MPLHTARLVKEAAGGDVAHAVVAVCGVSYIPDVADTRNSPTAILVDDLLAAGATVRVHDPIVRAWVEKPEIPIVEELEEVVRDVDGVVLAVPHLPYRKLAAATLVRRARRPGFVIDAQNVLSETAAGELHAAGWRVLGVGKGHWRKRGLHHARP